MTDEIYVYFVKLPRRISEMVSVGPNGYSIYIDTDLDEKGRVEAYRHAMRHIMRDDFSGDDVQAIEYLAHSEE